MTGLFPVHTIETAPEEARPALTQLGFVPTMMAKFADAPLLLQGYQTAAGLFDKTSFSSIERLVVLLTASYLNNCDFCMSAHSWGAGRQGLECRRRASRGTASRGCEAGSFAGLRSGADPEARRSSGSGSEGLFEAGFTSGQALEAILGVATKVMTNYTNALAVPRH
jgi:AhpD family alkylhydroperoxidase